MNRQHGTRRMIIFDDRSGNMYAVPQEVFEQHKLSEVEMEHYSSLLESDVWGCAMSLGDQEAGERGDDGVEDAMLFKTPKRDRTQHDTTSDIFPLLLGIIRTTHPDLREKPVGAWPT